jgi:hypothetical protein
LPAAALVAAVVVFFTSTAFEVVACTVFFVAAVVALVTCVTAAVLAVAFTAAWVVDTIPTFSWENAKVEIHVARERTIVFLIVFIAYVFGE